MSKQTEALKLALDALVRADRISGYPNNKNTITAIREALAEQPDYRAVKTWHDGKPVYVAEQPASGLNPLWVATHPDGLTTPQPAQQEPVAWANPNDLQNFDMKVRTNGGPLHTVPLYTSPQSAQQQEPVAKVVTDNSRELVVESLNSKYLRKGTKLYTSPPASKPWVGLTDEDIQQVREQCGITHHAVKTIEAKLREKNT